ncbi:hypothetical protein ACQJBY_069894 [Aegilops geniculata]
MKSRGTSNRMASRRCLFCWRSSYGAVSESIPFAVDEPAAGALQELPAWQVVRGVVGSLKVITRQASLRVAEYVFHYAKTNGRERVSAIHKANIMRKTDRLFLKYCCAVAEKYPEIT